MPKIQGIGCGIKCTQRLLANFRTSWHRKVAADQRRMNAMILTIVLACCLLKEVGGQDGTFDENFRPYYQFHGQVLTSCEDTPVIVPDGKLRNIRTPMVCRAPHAETTCCQKPFIEPSEVTTGASTGQNRLRACTHDSSTRYTCSTGDAEQQKRDPGCSCYSNCLAYESLGPECLDVVYAIEDSWGYFNMSIDHNADGGSMSFSSRTEYHLIYKMTVSYGELDLLGTLYNCTWVPIDKYNTADKDRMVLKEVCDVPIHALPGDWSSVGKAPHHMRYARYEEADFLFKMSLEFSGIWSVVDQLIRFVSYKAKWEVNSQRIRSPIYSALTYKKAPNELLKLEVFQRIDADPVRAKQGTGRLKLQQEPWTQVGDFTILVHIIAQNDAPVIAQPKDNYQPPPECVDPTSELPECNFGQFYVYEGTDELLGIQGVVISDVDVYEACSSSDSECRRIDVAVRAHKGTLKLNTRSDLFLYYDERDGSGFTARINDLNSAVKVLFYAIENTNLLNTPKSTVTGYNTQHSGGEEFVTVTVSDQGFSGRSGLAETSTIRIDVVVVAVNDGPVVTSQMVEFAPFEDILSPVSGVQIMDRDLEERIISSLASRNWMGKASNSLYLNQMQATVSVTYGVLKIAYTRNLQLMRTTTTLYMTIAPLRFGHDVCMIDTLIENSKALSAHWNEVSAGAGTGANDASVGKYQGLCSYDNVGGETCPTGEQAGCRCFKNGQCNSLTGKLTLHLNRSKQDSVLLFRDALSSLFNSINRTCGGMPVYPAPNNFTVGKPCANDKICTELSKCVPGKTCTCCANMSFVCENHKDCDHFDQGSFCGCMSGGAGLCGPYWLKADGPSAKHYTDIIAPGQQKPEFDGVPCTYVGPGSDTCKSAAFAAEGTDVPGIVDLVGMSSLGTKEAIIFGPLLDLNRALESLHYETDLNFNRFFRPPLEERDPFTFNIEEDSLDTLVVTAYDFGNSGGGAQDAKSMKIEIPIRVVAVNDRPQAIGPATVRAFEDIPFHFTELTDIPADNYQGMFESLGAFHDPHPLRGPRFRIADPDFKDYLFDTKIFTVNISCQHGRLFLNEGFLKSKRINRRNPNKLVQYQVGMAQEDKDTTWQPGIVYKIWEPYSDVEGQDLKGLINVEFNSQGEQTRGTKVVRYGNGCQFQPQCADGANAQTTDNHYGFFETQWYGVVYPPAVSIEEQRGSAQANACGVCPDVVGNRFISIEGTFDDINKALELVTYLPDPHFNTRAPGKVESITLSVNDGGAMGNDDASSIPLSHTHVVKVIVDSINDRPIIGRRVKKYRANKKWVGGRNKYGGIQLDKNVLDDAIFPINKTSDSVCMRLAPSGSEYKDMCNAAKRSYIDVDEDTLFYIAPQVLWIHDVDAEEATKMPTLRRWCCDEAGETACVCNRVCRCGSNVCKCQPPNVCSGGAGELLVSFKVRNGLLSLYPPAGRVLFPQSELEFQANLTELAMDQGGMIEPCANQRSCMQNVSKIEIKTKLPTLQKALDQLFLTYLPKTNFFGTDVLEIYVNDQGYTDECYNASLGVREEINIRVVGVNDPPVINMSDKVLLYNTGEQCYFEFQTFRSNQPEGLNSRCVEFPNNTKVPRPDVGPAWRFDDIEMDFSPYGNMTVLLQVGNSRELHVNAGSFLLKETLLFSKIWLTQSRTPTAPDGLLTMEIAGKMDEINRLMNYLVYSADPKFQGYAPFIVTVLDEFNFGECSGDHRCGASQSVCMDPSTAEDHASPKNGITRNVVDMTIGAPAKCQASVLKYGTKQAACEACNKEPVVDGVGCGWCPTACPDLGGKCMIANAGKGPRFENCPTKPGELGWKQCVKPKENMVLIGGLAGGVPFASIVIGYIFLRWVQRRHGSLRAYSRRKHYDVKVILKRFSLLPPENANYFQFVLLIAIAVAVRIGIGIAENAARYEPLCDFKDAWFLDAAADLTMKLDNCRLNFFPASTQPPPDNELLALKVKLAITKDPNIVVDSSTCGREAKFEVQNKKDESVRYLKYYCSIQIIIPLNGFVIPTIKIEATGDNVTTVDSRPDPIKSPDFRLDFGPNDFKLAGKRMMARIHRVLAKNLEFKVDHGRLLLIDMSCSNSAVFESETADMIVTSPLRSSVKFLQNDNKVCLTAANGSLYVDDACENVCRMRYPNGTLLQGTAVRRSWDNLGEVMVDNRGSIPEDPTSTKELSQRPYTKGHFPHADFKFSTRVLGAETTDFFGLEVTDPVGGKQGMCNGTGCIPFECTGQPGVDETWECRPYDAIQVAKDQLCPAGSKYLFVDDVPRVPGCTDLSVCKSDESSQCLCKPGCDMKNLNPKGVCDVGGRCCQILCVGYSKADMLPYENMPRCPQSNEQPWCNGKLDQQVRFLSKTGQISFQVGYCSATSPGDCTTFGANKQPVALTHSYKGSSPSDNITIPLDISKDHKDALNDIFHPGGSSRPKEEWFTFSLDGPGTPEQSHGEFIWVGSIRHLILKPWFMDVLSYKILTPERKASSLNLNPGFCPNWINYTRPEFYNRLKKMYQVIKDTVEKYPGPGENVIPTGTMIVFKPVTGNPIWFGVDPKSNLLILGYVVPSDYPLLTLLLVVGILIPVLVAAATVMFTVSKYMAHLHEYRKTRLIQEQTMRFLHLVMAGKGPDPGDELSIPKEYLDEMVARTGYWYMFEEFVASAEDQRSHIGQVLMTVSQYLVALLPVAFPFMLNTTIEQSYRKAHCEYRSDVCDCRNETEGVLYLTMSVKILIDIYTIVAIIDQAYYFLDFSYGLFGKILRHLFYALLATFIYLSMLGFVIVLLFIVLGIMLKPETTFPYIIAVGGEILVTLLLAVKILKFHERVGRAVTKHITLYKTKVADIVPKEVLDAVMSKNIAQALFQNGISIPNLVLTLGIYNLSMGAIFFFLFTAFEAFTAKGDLYASMINDAILLITVYISYYVAVVEGDANDLNYRVEVMNDQVMETLQRTLDMMVAQIVTARNMVKKMKKQMQLDENDQVAEDYYSASDTDSDSVEDMKKR